MAEFEEFQKIARLSRGCVVTEKIDGTNAQVLITEFFAGDNLPDRELHLALRERADDLPPLVMLAGSRNRYVTPHNDNFGFAGWVKTNAAALWALGEGRHFGEWWGSGVQRGYGLQKGEKRWSLFNVARWDYTTRDREKYPTDRPACCDCVPVLYSGEFTTSAVDIALDHLRTHGSVAAPGFMKPEGVVVWHDAARTLFKKTIEKDEEPKGKRVA